MSRFLKTMFTLAACMIVLASQALRAWWVPDGIPVYAWPGSQQNPEICSDGMGGAFVVWEDNSSGDYNLYAWRMDASGNFPWGGGGSVDISWVPEDQRNPAIIPDGAGGAFIAWQDGRDGNDDIYMQRVNSIGDTRWAAAGAALCTATGNQTTPRIIPDGGGGMIVIWQDNRSSGNDVYAQRVNALGSALWTADGVPICTAIGSQYVYTMVSDGTGGAIVAWVDNRASSYDVYAQRVDRYGTAMWTANGVAVCTAADDQNSPAITADGAGGAIISWTDARGTTGNVYAQRVNASGATQWTANGVRIYANDKDIQGLSQIASDGAGGAVVAWAETRDGGNGYYAQHLNASGARLWPEGGVTLGDGVSELNILYGCPDGAGGLIVTWIVNLGGTYDLFVQKVSVSGALPWGSAPTTVSAAIDDQTYPSIVPDGTGGAILAWRDGRNGGYGYYDIYAQLVDGAGRAGGLAPEIASAQDVPGDQGGQVFLSWDAARADRFMDSSMSHYSIWRSINSTQAVSAIEDGASEIASLSEFDLPSGAPVIRVEQMGALTIYWQLVDTHDALFMEGYGLPVATLFDSTATCGDPHYFQVVAHTTDPRVFWTSEAASGWSVDNLAPCPPAGFEGEQSFTPIGLYLTWDPNAEGDFSCYALYRGLSADFVPGAGNLVGQLDETWYFDGDWSWDSGYCYKISAFDINGNESEYASFLQGNLTGDELPAAPAASFLSQNFPNPFNPITKIVFGLAEPAAVRLRVYDAAGHLVRSLIDETMPAGRYAETWDGRDTRGSTVASGVYFYRLDAGAFTETRKMVLLR